mgnify:CR=1 FL=1
MSAEPTLDIIRRDPVGEAQPTPLLFVHGAWHANWCWDVHFLDHFAALGYEVAAVSLRGHGESEGRGRLRRTRVREYVADVERAAATMTSRPVVVGHSMGGMVVQKFLERHDAPGGVLVASVPPKGVIGITLRLARERPLTFAKVNATMSLWPFVSDPEHAKALFYSEDLAAADDYVTRLQDESFFGFLDMLALDRPKPKRVTAPVLVLGGERDVIFPPSDVRDTAAAYGTEAHLFPMAHNMMAEDGWEAVADRIDTWVRSVTAGV